MSMGCGARRGRRSPLPIADCRLTIDGMSIVGLVIDGLMVVDYWSGVPNAGVTILQCSRRCIRMKVFATSVRICGPCPLLQRIARRFAAESHDSKLSIP